MNHPRLLVEVAVAQGADRPALLEHTGLRPEMLDSVDARASYLQFGVLAWNALRLTGNTALGLDFGRASHLANQGMLGMAMLSSRTVGDAMRTAIEYYRVLAPGWSLSLDLEGDAAVFRAVPAIPFGELYVFATDALLSTIHRISASLMRNAIPLREVRLDFPAPPHVARYFEFFGGPFVFDAGVIETRFDASVLEDPVPSSDPVTAALARRVCDEQLSQLPPAGTLLDQVHGILERVTDTYPTIDELAEHLSMSGRSLRRALARFDASYQDLVAEARRERALHYLRTTNLGVDDIAQRLGFSDSRSFRRAFKQWTGKTPLELRAAKA